MIMGSASPPSLYRAEAGWADGGSIIASAHGRAVVLQRIVRLLKVHLVLHVPNVATLFFIRQFCAYALEKGEELLLSAKKRGEGDKGAMQKEGKGAEGALDFDEVKKSLLFVSATVSALLQKVDRENSVLFNLNAPKSSSGCASIEHEQKGLVQKVQEEKEGGEGNMGSYSVHKLTVIESRGNTERSYEGGNYSESSNTNMEKVTGKVRKRRGKEEGLVLGGRDERERDEREGEGEREREREGGKRHRRNSLKGRLKIVALKNVSRAEMDERRRNCVFHLDLLHARNFPLMNRFVFIHYFLFCCCCFFFFVCFL